MAEDIYNADETGLFWCMLPHKMLAVRREKCSSGKNSKEKMAVLIEANIDGLDKLPTYVHGEIKESKAL